MAKSKDKPKKSLRSRLAFNRVTGVTVAVVAGVAFVIGRLFLFPPTDVVVRTDAVTVFGGAGGERLETAVELMEQNVATVLVLPHGTHPAWPLANALCDGDPGYEVVCPDPDPDTTRGEARLVGGLAAERGWTRVAVVSSTYHLTRSSSLLRRCTDAEIDLVAAGHGVGVTELAGHVLHELAGYVGSWFEREC
ncbi:MAG: YdcF family protein [Actinomycetota bacterium]|nr:YdcF family protein [Actinomycetota bacterium]